MPFLEDREKLRAIVNELDHLKTEEVNPVSSGIDHFETENLLRVIHEQDRTVADIVDQAIPEITGLVEAATWSLQNNGRLVYVGAGTSGRLGVLDAAECPPTYGCLLYTSPSPRD